MENRAESTRIFHKLIVFMIGVALSIAGTAMLISGTFNLDKFYDVGEVYDVHSATLKSYPVNMVYDYNNDCFVLQETTGRKGINLGKNHEKKWNYIVIELANMNVPNIMGRIDYHNSKNELVHYKDVSLVEGTNIISSENVKYSQIIVNFFSAAGTMVKIDKIQFREQAPVFSWKVAILYFSMILGIYYLVIQFLTFHSQRKLS